MLLQHCLLLVVLFNSFLNSNGEFCAYESCYDSAGTAKPCIPPPAAVALERNVTVTNTCGEKERETYCELTGGQCRFCNASSPSEQHPANYLVDKNEQNWWQSQSWWYTNKAGLTTISNPLKVNITLSFGKSYVIAGHVQVTFRYERPQAMVIERSIDDGHTWKTLQYFAKRCDIYYNMPTENSVSASDPFKVQCTEKYSLEHPKIFGEVKYIGEERYEICNFMSPTVQESLLATDIRIRLEYPATDGMEKIFKDDKEHMVKYYYSITDIEITGRCFCNGHASSCDGELMDRKCVCEHNTMGKDCEKCKPLYNNRPWMSANLTHGNECEECHCNNRGISCVYNSTLGYGLCTGCRNNSEGDHCEKCVDEYYRDLSKPLNDTGACIACDCYPEGITNNGSCLQNATSTDPIGQCSCKANVYGRQCNRCKPGHWGFTLPPKGECRDCKCNTLGTIDGSIECHQETGQCTCKPSIQGKQCQECKLEFYGFPQTKAEGCRRCPCDLGGAYPGCHKDTGSCYCRNGVEGHRCTHPSHGRFYPALDFLLFEAEMETGTFVTVTPATGMGSAFTGRGYAKLPSGTHVHFSGVNVNITHNYSIIVRYSASGQCTTGVLTMNMTGPNVHKVVTSPASMLQTELGHAAIMPDLVAMVSGVDYSVTVSYNGSSTCELLIDSLVLVPDFNTTRIFTMSSEQVQNTLQQCYITRSSLSSIHKEGSNCSGMVFSASTQIYNGTLECNCNPEGSKNDSYCDSYGGQCHCKPGVGGRTCNHCLPGYHGFSNSGCTKCSCSDGGSLSSVCNVETGLCSCKPDVIGKNCDQCKANYYNLDAGNVQGCQPCFGYGHSTQCNSASGFVRQDITTNFDSNSDRLRSWTVVDSKGIDVQFADSWNDGLIITTPPSSSILYLSAPRQYLGDKLYSYKQRFSLNMDIKSLSSNATMMNASDVIISGHRANVTMSLHPTPSKAMNNYEVVLDEHHVTSRKNMTSYEFQSMLTNVKSLHVRATYYPSPDGTVTFKNVSMIHAVRENVGSGSDPVKFVENSTCHQNYTGNSCEKCAPGYKREIPFSDPFSRCVLCVCNGRSTECDAQSGNCTNCQVGTYGDRCQYCENNVLGPNCTECKAGYWGLSRSGCRACNCHVPGTWYQNSTVCDKVTGQCACNTTMNVNDKLCDKCKENAYNASEGISDCRECSSCYAFVQTDVHLLRPQVTQLTNLTIDLANHPVMQHGKTFITRLQEVIHKVRQLMTTAAHAKANDSVFSVKWTALEQELAAMETNVNVNLSSVVDTSSNISAHVKSNHEKISRAIAQVTQLVSKGYLLLNTSVVQRVDVSENFVMMLDNLAIELVPLAVEAERLLNSTLHSNSSLHSGIDYAVRRANLTGVHALTVQRNESEFSPYLPQLLNNATFTKKLGEEATKMATSRLQLTIDLLNETRHLEHRASQENPDNKKTLQDLQTRSSGITTDSSNYANQSITSWASSTSVMTQVYSAIERARDLVKSCNHLEQNVTAQRASAELANQIAMNATSLANQIHAEAIFMRDVLKNFDTMSKEVALRANASLTKVFGIDRGLDEVIDNATAVNASIHAAVVASRQAVKLATDAKKHAENDLMAITNALERAKRLQNETNAKEEVIANQTVRNYIRTEIEPVEKLCQNISNAANQMSTKVAEAFRQANETDTKSRRVIDRIRQAENESSTLVLSSSDDSLRALEKEISRVRQRYVNLNLEPSVKQLKEKLESHRSKQKEYLTKRNNLQAEIGEVKKLIMSLKMVASQC